MVKHKLSKIPKWCRDKRKYATRQEAQAGVDSLQADIVFLPEQPKPAAYLCPHGDHWHVGSNRRKA